MEAIVWVVLAIPVIIAIGMAWVAFEPIVGPGPLLALVLLFALLAGVSMTVFAAIAFIGLAAVIGGIISS